MSKQQNVKKSTLNPLEGQNGRGVGDEKRAAEGRVPLAYVKSVIPIFQDT